MSNQRKVRQPPAPRGEKKIALTPGQSQLVLRLLTERERITREAKSALASIETEFSELARMIAGEKGEKLDEWRISPEGADGAFILTLLPKPKPPVESTPPEPTPAPPA